MNQKPVFGTKEWASSTINMMIGCQHDCKYCYAKSAACEKRGLSIDKWKEAEVKKGIVNKGFRKREGTIMFPSSHDIHPDNLFETVMVLRNILISDNNVLVVSKPHIRCIEAICALFFDYRDKILFRFTIGSANKDTLRFWEPNAPDFTERMTSLVIAFNHGFKTSISCEPMLDNEIHKVVEEVEKYVTDSIWLGKANFLENRLIANGHSDNFILDMAKQLAKWQSDEEIMELYDKYKDHPKIKWKESIKKVVGLEIPTEQGLDV